MEGEQRYPEVIAPRHPQPVISDRPQPLSSTAGPSRDTAFRSHPQVKEKEITTTMVEPHKAGPSARK
jgi:hypothetical protein